MSDGLKPCPFCGAAAQLVYDEGDQGYPRVGCNADECFGPDAAFCTEELAIAAWNRRSPDAEERAAIVKGIRLQVAALRAAFPSQADVWAVLADTADMIEAGAGWWSTEYRADLHTKRGDHITKESNDE